MSRLRVAPIVEGHGEVSAVRVLLTRIWLELVGGEHLDVLQPVRQPRTKLLSYDAARRRYTPDADQLDRALGLAAAKLRLRGDDEMPGLVMLLLDADCDCPKELGPELLRVLQERSGSQDVAVTLANVEYETWFVAAAESLQQHLRLGPGDGEIDAPEQRRCGKGWIEQRFLAPKYSETVDQVRLTRLMNLEICRQRCPSFDKLCRDLQSRFAAAEQ